MPSCKDGLKSFIPNEPLLHHHRTMAVGAPEDGPAAVLVRRGQPPELARHDGFGRLLAARAPQVCTIRIPAVTPCEMADCPMSDTGNEVTARRGSRGMSGCWRSLGGRRWGGGGC
jgi:hypothetical protein